MKQEIRYCDVCKKECTGSIGKIHFTPLSIFGVDYFDVCDSCFRDIRKYIRLKSKN